MIIGIYPNPNRDINLKTTKKLISLLKLEGIDYVVDDKVDIDIDSKRGDVSTISDVVVTLGGDGTILHYIRQAKSYKAPILGINLGNMGYLTEASSDEIDNVVFAIKMNNYKTASRDLIDIVTEKSTYCALNEGVIAIGERFKLLAIDMYIDNTLVDNYMADGLIFSTPTGSTAYALAAGGPIISPNLNAIIVVPICAHSINKRPIVISNEQTIKLKLTSEYGARLVVDGVEVETMSKNSILTIKKSNKNIKLIHLSNINFYNRIRNKLNN